jgi:hypothetical protein
MTGYTITIGYLSGAVTQHDADIAWEYVHDRALDICAHPEWIVDEARAFDAPDIMRDEALVDYARAFQNRTDLTITFHPAVDDERPYIHMYASGGMPSRALKEYTRQAFIRLLLRAAHREGIDLSIRVS